MNLNEIKKVLEENFNKDFTDGKKRHIIFWYDEESEFVDEIDELDVENAKLLKLNNSNSFAVKYKLEKEDINSNYLIYANMPKPSPRENWLLDILKYSSEFSTDKTTIIMRGLNVKEGSLKEVFKKYMKFFDSKDRYKRFASYDIQGYTEEKVHIGILSALCKLTVCDFEEVVKTLLMEETKDKNKYWQSIDKYGYIDKFWRSVESYYGFTMQEKSLEKLMIFFMITNLSSNLEEEIPKTWREYISLKSSDCIVFIDHFMNHSVNSKIYNELANTIEEKLNLKEYVSKWILENYVYCDTFKYFDEAILNKLINQLLDDIEEFDRYTEVIFERRKLHWYEVFENEYNAVYYAIELLRMQKKLNKKIKQHNAYDFIDIYAKEYYQLDMFYRKFYAAFDKSDNKEVLMDLRERIENTYTNWYLKELSMKWANAVEEELTEEWRIPALTQQKDFYEVYIASHIRKGERAFVIISDALRYEAAKEFSEILNTERKGATEIFAMQGSIPSYTKLGMASLLPNKKISINDKLEVAEIVVDGISSNGIENRNKILLNHCKNSIAVKCEDVIDKKRPEIQKLLTGKELIYIYHDSIDAIGDHAGTEKDVFNAVDKTFNELSLLIRKLVNDLSATYMYITSDHGFIYRRGRLTESDKISKKVQKAAEDKRRFILSDKEENNEGTISIDMKYIFGDDTDYKVTIPRGVNRFKVQGAGANYVHGGAALQEVVVPVVKFKNDRSKSDKNVVKKVDVKLTNISRKITNSITYLEFFQTEKVEDKRVPLRLKLYLIDEEGNRISNENIIIADSKSSKPEDRTYREKFTLRDVKYDKNKKYYLVLEDEEETVEKIYEKIPFVIDIAITNDFEL